MTLLETVFDSFLDNGSHLDFTKDTRVLRLGGNDFSTGFGAAFVMPSTWRHTSPGV